MPKTLTKPTYRLTTGQRARIQAAESSLQEAWRLIADVYREVASEAPAAERVLGRRYANLKAAHTAENLDQDPTNDPFWNLTFLSIFFDEEALEEALDTFGEEDLEDAEEED